MDVFTVDQTNSRVDIFDSFEDFVWSERASAMGDFEMSIEDTQSNRQKLRHHFDLVIDSSRRSMRIEQVLRIRNEKNQRIIKLSGRSAERIFLDRVARRVMSSTEQEENWELTGTPGAIVREIVQRICVEGVLSSTDIIPNFNMASLYPIGTIPEPVDEQTIEVSPTSVYDAIKKLCDLYNLGFRMVRNPGNRSPTFFFDVYAGNDLTKRQTAKPPVVFSPNLENLQNMNELVHSLDLKNVAYVFGPMGARTVYAPGADPTTVGFDKRVLFVDASDINNPSVTQSNRLMDRRGREALNEHNSFHGFDGEIAQTSTYKYGVDYELNDIVQFENAEGSGADMRVKEQIFTADREGEKSYPTFEINEYVGNGTWLSWDAIRSWSQATPTEYWGNMP